MTMPDADAYRRSFHDTRARIAHLWTLHQGMGSTTSRHGVETFLFHTRMLIESFCVMARDGRLARGDLSRNQLKAYRPDDILRVIADLADVRFIALESFALRPGSTVSDMGFDIAYAGHVAVDPAELARLHGRLGAFAHVTGRLPDEEDARQLMDECAALYARLSPLLKRHLLEVTSGPRASDACLDGLALLIGYDDADREWFVEWSPDRINVRLAPPLV